MQHDLVTRPFAHVDGWMYPPTGPGLGIDVIEDVVNGYRSEKVLAQTGAPATGSRRRAAAKARA